MCRKLKPNVKKFKYNSVHNAVLFVSKQLGLGRECLKTFLMFSAFMTSYPYCKSYHKSQ
jgi:hypothetical protein